MPYNAHAGVGLLRDAAQSIDDLIDAVDRNRGKIAFCVGLFIGVIAGRALGTPALGTEAHPDYLPYHLEMTCPTGQRVFADTTEAEIIVLYVMAASGKITPQQWAAQMLKRYPDRGKDITEFAHACLGLGGDI